MPSLPAPPSHATDQDAVQQLPRDVITVPQEYSFAAYTPPHRHSRAQLLFAAEGLVRVRTAQGVWVLPPRRALWIPSGLEHEVTMLSRVSMRSLYVDARRARSLWQDCCVIEVSGLLRELILNLAAAPPLYPLEGRAGQIAALILTELADAAVVPLRIPWPQDRRLRGLCEAVLAQPGQVRSIIEWSEEAGASARTLIRLFQAELGMNYRQWVQQVRLADAVRRLALGEPVAQVARALGYRSPSAFSKMFRKALGHTPQDYALRDGKPR